ncbi:HEPN domain-containing protein [Pseudomonas synxantha]|uniref:HEPN domain-containing protein n=1 Tax=Pseudomonas synxantha TaxID=47883 RepID=UPI00099B5855|nr:HEPN domain-containing protein [Pseudomonas synxantha]OPB02368.1 hypothetical protein BFW89_15145 [Pseudomonas synxantha]
MTSLAKTAFEANKIDIERLWEIHGIVAGHGVGRKFGVEVLNRSAIVFITACWESFIEDLATQSFDFLLANAKNHEVIPAKVRNYAARKLVDVKDPSRLWDLADGGWRNILSAHKQSVYDDWVGTLNTPKTPQVNALYSQLLGIPKLSECWYWQKMSAVNAESKLDEYITIRGNIAHRIRDENPIPKLVPQNFLVHIAQLVDRTESYVENYLFELTEVKPFLFRSLVTN